jgi:hypothetical protein
MDKTLSFYDHRDRLVAKIGQTNNGYVFAPTPMEVLIATMYPATFGITANPAQNTFPIRITLKK